jgi:arylsulfatase A-like enzyme
VTLTRRSLLVGSVAARPARKTNVVMFMTDDHGAWATGAYGCPEIQTPNIDRLAREGAQFTRAYACTPVCSPSRMTYMTGKLPAQHGVQDYLLPEDSSGPTTIRFLDGHTTYAEILASHGYKLGMCGKWHMGDDERAQRGFTWWRTVPGGGGTYRDPEFVTNGSRRKLTGFKTDLVADSALDFLDQAADGPFYLLVPFYAPHTPYDYQPDAYRQPYLDSKFSCFPDEPMHPWQNASLAKDHGNRNSKLSYSALVTGMDTNVGRILRKLEQLKVRENTLVVFTADQGYNCGHHGVWGKGNGTWPFNLYEESLRVPLIWNHPGRIRGGLKPAPMVSSYDYLPTLLDYLGLPQHKDERLPGHSYAGFLRGLEPKWRNRLYFEYSYMRGLRTETLKYIERTKEWPSELYDLEADPGEKRNVLDDPKYQKVASGLRTELDQYFETRGAPPIEQWRSTTRQRLFQYKRYSQ